MDVSLVSVTSSTIYEANSKRPLTPEELVVYVARVSNPKNQKNIGTSQRLIKYLIEHQHWSPFEMVDMTLEIKTSRAIAAQILRHRSFSFQEFSQRYSEVVDIEPIELRRQAENNRQSSTDQFNPVLNGLENEFPGGITAEEAVRLVLTNSEIMYKALISNGVAKECARMILPSCAQTTLYMKGSLRSWIHYIQLRTKEDTQLEHRQIAEKAKEIFSQQFPMIGQAVFEVS